MSQENMEIVRRGTDHFNETGEPPWELLDPEVEWTIDPPAWAAGTYRGHAELRDLARRIGEVFDEFRYDFDEYLSAGDRVVGIGGDSRAGGPERRHCGTAGGGRLSPA
jgi:ketosteroid isomerase-like protein